MYLAHETSGNNLEAFYREILQHEPELERDLVWLAVQAHAQLTAEARGSSTGGGGGSSGGSGGSPKWVIEGGMACFETQAILSLLVQTGRTALQQADVAARHGILAQLSTTLKQWTATAGPAVAGNVEGRHLLRLQLAAIVTALLARHCVLDLCTPRLQPNVADPDHLLRLLVAALPSIVAALLAQVRQLGGDPAPGDAGFEGVGLEMTCRHLIIVCATISDVQEKRWVFAGKPEGLPPFSPGALADAAEALLRLVEAAPKISPALGVLNPTWDQCQLGTLYSQCSRAAMAAAGVVKVQAAWHADGREDSPSSAGQAGRVRAKPPSLRRLSDLAATAAKVVHSLAAAPQRYRAAAGNAADGMLFYASTATQFALIAAGSISKQLEREASAEGGGGLPEGSSR